LPTFKSYYDNPKKYDSDIPEEVATDDKQVGFVSYYDAPEKYAKNQSMADDVMEVPARDVTTLMTPEEGEITFQALKDDLGLDIPFIQAAQDRDIIKETASKNPYARYRQDEAERYLSAVSTIGVANSQQGRIHTFEDIAGQMVDLGEFPDEKIIEEQLKLAETFLKRGEITQDEFDKAKAFMEETGKPITGGDLVPAHLYDKSWSERAGEVLPAAGAGINMFMAGLSDGARWLEAETGLQVNAKKASDFFKANAEFIAPKRRDFATDIFTGVGSLFPALATGGVTGFGARSLGVSARMSGYLELTAATGSEAFVNTGLDFSERLEETGDEHKAIKTARTSFVLNVGLAAVTNKLGLFAGRLDALKKANQLGAQRTLSEQPFTTMQAIRNELADSAITGAKGFGGEATQEGGQEIISAVAQKKPIEANKVAYASVLGGIIGAPAAVVLAYAEGKIDEIPPLPPELQRTYDDTVKSELDRGMTEEQANISATKEIAKTPEGRRHIEKTSEAMDAMLMAEASMGDKTLTEEQANRNVAEAQKQIADAEDIIPPAGLITEEEITELAEQGITEDELIDELFARSLEVERTEAQIAEEVELIQESLPTATNIEQIDPVSVARLGSPASRAFKATMPNGSEITVLTGAQIEVTDENIETIRETYVKPGLMTEEDLQAGNFVAVGKNKAIGQDGVIELAKEGTRPEVLNEEIYELAEKTVLTADEISALSKEFGESIEQRSKAYASWDGTSKTANGILEKIRDFFKGILNRFRTAPTAEDVFGAVRRGEVFERRAEGVEDETFALEPIRRATGQELTPEQRAERDALRASLRGQARAALTAAKEAKREAVTGLQKQFTEQLAETREQFEQERNTRREVTDLIADNLPVALRGKYQKALTQAKTNAAFNKIKNRVRRDIALFEETKELKKKLGSLRSKIAFIRKVGELNQTVINEVRAEVGLEKPLRQAKEEQLNEIIDKLKARLRFKRSRGFKPPIEGRETKSPEISEGLYKVNRDIKKTTKTGYKKRLADTKEAAGEFSEKILGVISSRLADIDPSLRQALRRFEFGVMKQTQQDKKKAVPYLDKVAKLSKEDFEDLDLALKNGDVDKIKDITERNNMVKEFEAVREMLDDIYKRANEVGFDIGYRQNYFPRVITDTEGFLDYFHGREDWSIIDEAIKRKELALGRVLNEDEKANLINNMIRGYSGGNITLSETGAMKQRVIDFVGPEINKFYENANSSLLGYIDAVDNAIWQRKFFGKTLETDGKTEDRNNLEDSIGAYITDLIADQRISPSQEKEIRQILQARFGEAGTSGLIGIYKNLAYLTVMGSPFNAITQIGDLAFALYAGGPKNVLTSLSRSIIGKSVISKEDIGIDRIAAEVDTNSKMAEFVDRVFRMTGLTAIDSIGKESLINSVVLKYQEQAKNPTPEFTKKLEEVFADETQTVIDELASGVITENVKYLAFNELLNYQPAALSEVPQAYLTGGNGRIFYMLKTWTIKMLDVYRNEVFRTMKTDKVRATQNMIRLATLLMLMNASADALKDLLLGRPIDPNDIAIDNIAKLIGFSRYSVSQMGRDGVGSALFDQVTPPTNFIDNVWKDVGELWKNWGESVEVNKLKTIQDIPLIGKLYYWWFGRGVETKERKKRKLRREGR
jgi:hypothetical protein